VIDDRTPAAWRAGRVYIILAILGETALFASFMLATSAAHSSWIGDVQAGLAVSSWRDYAVAGLVIGFGMKAGVVPLHVWLPLAHGQAPTPASAVLSGVIIKAGIIGLMRFLPMGDAFLLGQVLVAMGLVTAFYGALVGLAQTNAKVVLAYSTLSQMGLLVTILGATLANPDAAPQAHDAVSFYAAHHGLAKAALFLSVGVVAASGRPALRWTIPIAALMALSVAGLPLSGGALAKLAIKDPLGDGVAAFLVTVSAVTTAMVMLRFMFLLASGAGRDAARPPADLVLPWAATVLAALVLPWALFTPYSPHPLSYAFTAENLWTGLWPILIAAGAAAVVLGLWRPSITVPEGDIVVFGEAAARFVQTEQASLARAVLTIRWPRLPVEAPARFAAFVEHRAQKWPVIAPVLLILAAVIGATLL
jgi:formate hydrogenlyase subunit 3/multisubunit Na+/H+ antiporter MnhD subunit